MRYEILTTSIPGPPTSGTPETYATWAATVAGHVHQQLWLACGVDERRQVINEFLESARKQGNEDDAKQLMLTGSSHDGSYLMGLILKWTSQDKCLDGFGLAGTFDNLIASYEAALDEVLRIKAKDTTPGYEMRGARRV